MVCLGNICRSPLAEGIMKKKIKERGLDWNVDSAGTANYHSGALPDKRSILTARENGIDIRDQRSRQIRDIDFYNHELILVMDAENYNNVVNIMPNNCRTRVELILNYSYPKQNRQVPDPYYEGGFDEVYELLDEACDKVIESIS